MRKAKVFYKDQLAGLLTQHDDGKFEFRYENSWLNDQSKPSISLTLTKQDNPFYSDVLFPFFYNMLPEGTNRQTVCFNLRIDQKDYFGILMATAKADTIGAVRIEKIIEI